MASEYNNDDDTVSPYSMEKFVEYIFDRLQRRPADRQIQALRAFHVMWQRSSPRARYSSRAAKLTMQRVVTPRYIKAVLQFN